MATTRPDQAAPDELERLRAKISDLDALASEAFAQIEGIATMMLEAFETPETFTRGEHIARVFEAIAQKASQTGDCIHSEAEEVGCAWHDEPARKRWDAIWAARDKAEGRTS